jgi:type VI secretion system secreted protein VgrG
MAELLLGFDSKEESLSVRRFAVSEEMSSLFSVAVWARSPDDDLDFETIVGKPAWFRLGTGARLGRSGARTFTGVCSHLEQERAESTGLSSYHLRIVPRLWLLTQRTNHRLFQHISIPDIVVKLLSEWRIEHELRIRRGDYPELELRAQYGESDFDFINRLLEEAGITYLFVDDAERGSLLVLTDAPQTSERRSGGPIPYVDSPSRDFEREYLTAVRVAQRVRPGKVTLRDFDFRRNPAFPFYANKGSGHPIEDDLEQYSYAPNAFLVEVERGAAGRAVEAAKTAAASVMNEALGAVERRVSQAIDQQATKVLGEVAGQALGDAAGRLAGDLMGKLASSLGIVEAVGGLAGDDRGMARASEKFGFSRAQKQLESARASRRTVTFETNQVDLSPGTVLTVGSHARKDLGPDRALLVTELSLEGTHDGEWLMCVAATFAELPYRPPQKTAKPAVQGLQSAVVTGPAGQEIHTDESGRVRVQFHWDREGKRDENSSCWMRVSHGWAGSSFGMIAIPRVGQEVLVAFLEGDPDHPVVVGRLYNSTSRVPYSLPENKTKSGWKSASSPGSGGFNEIMFEDARGRELVNFQAERDLEKLVKRDESIVVGHERRATIGTVDTTHANERHTVTVGKQAGLTYTEITPGRIHLSTGGASITLDGDEIRLEAKGKILLHSTGDDVVLLGGPWVKINCGPEDDHVDHELTLVDHFGNPIVHSFLKGELSIDGEVTENHEAFTSRVIRLAPGQTASVKLTMGDDEPDDGDDEQGEVS